MLFIHISVSVAESYQQQKKSHKSRVRFLVLKLTCNIFHLIITGNKQTLLTCLFNHLQAPANNMKQTATVTGTASMLSSIMAELITLKADIADNRRQSVVNSSPSPDIVDVAVNKSPVIPFSAAVYINLPCDDHTQFSIETFIICWPNITLALIINMNTPGLQ